MNSRFGSRSSALIGALLLMLAAGCDPPERRIAVAEPAGIAIVDPAFIRSEAEARLASSLFLPLFADSDTAGGLVESFEASDGNRSLTLRLRDATFSDGVRITAETLRLSWLRLLAPETSSPHAFRLTEIVDGALEYSRGLAPASAVGIRVSGNRELRVLLREPEPLPALRFGHPSLAAVPLHAVIEDPANWAAREDVPTSGAFLPVTGDSESRELRLLFRENPAFLRTMGSASTFDIFELVLMDAGEALGAYRAGRVDAVLGLASADLDGSVPATPRCEGPIDLLVLAVRKPPFDDAAARSALAGRVRSAFQEAGTQSQGVLPMLFGGCEGTGVSADAQAASLVADPAQQVLRILVPDRAPGPVDLAVEAIRSALATTSIETRVDRLASDAYLRGLRDGMFEIAYIRWSGSDTALVRAFAGTSPLNDAEYHNDAYDELIRRAASADRPTAEDLYRRAARMLVEEDHVIVPLQRTVSYDILPAAEDEKPVVLRYLGR